MHHLVYTSHANFLLTEEELHRLLGPWRTKNAGLNVTGVLLYSAGDILQVLEGDAQTLYALYATIAADARHRNVTRLADGPVPGRVFADWSMQFRAVDAADFKRFVQQIDQAPDHARSLAPLLEAFMEQEPWS